MYEMEMKMNESKGISIIGKYTKNLGKKSSSRKRNYKVFMNGPE